MKRAASPPPTDYCEDDELYEAILLSLSKPADALATFTEEMHMAAALTLSQRQNQPPGPFDRLIKLGGSIVADLIVPVLVAHGSWRNLSSFLSVNSHLFTQLYPAVKARHRSQMMKWDVVSKFIVFKHYRRVGHNEWRRYARDESRLICGAVCCVIETDWDGAFTANSRLYIREEIEPRYDRSGTNYAYQERAGEAFVDVDYIDQEEVNALMTTWATIKK